MYEVYVTGEAVSSRLHTYQQITTTFGMGEIYIKCYQSYLIWIYIHLI
jgi:hypothetical protein